MPVGPTITITLTREDHRRAEKAAKRLAIPLEVLARNAVITAIEGVKLKPEYTPQQLTWIHRKGRAEGKVWTEEELRERNLPLFWSKAWVEDQLAQGNSYAQIALNAGGWQVVAVSTHLRRVHGIQKVHRKTEAQKEAIRARIQQGATREEIMREFELSDFGAGQYFKLEGARTELQLRFLQEAEKVPWPATREQIADILFGGVKHKANNWVSVRLERGWLVKVAYGQYELAPEFRES
ncbi:hypothetical protein [Deinococcus radiotolerans]|uniref:Uncharacterized protein n=1 Tax=Deinococcus radiotolerans TaxID=1309407 RepID=A0ABQ2FIR2_9DEIO|nr:hypothetical protein [Deinococcus radiotolerans]GGK91283.1 hypothetical protein GCM10010844_07220 [Deinococcus radiotolerans]